MAAPRTAPAGTTVRFGLLIALAVGITVLVYLLMMPPGLLFNGDVQIQCQVVSGLYFDGTDLSPFQVERLNERSLRLRECLAQYLPLRLPWLAGGLLALGGLATLIYLSLPRLRIRRGRLVPLDLTADPELTAELNDLVERAGLRVRPEVLVDPVNPRTGGLAFGTRRRPYVCLDAGLITRFRTDPGYFRVVVLHEFAHLRNNDVPITYLTIAVWRAFLIVGLLPFLAVMLDPWLTSATPFASPLPLWAKGYLNGIVEMVLQVLGLVLVVLLSRNAVLRAREHHADDRMASWLGRATPHEVLVSVPGTTRHWGALVRTHPLLANRINAVRDPARLLRPGFWEAAAAGVAIQIAWRAIALALTTIGQTGPYGLGPLHAVWGTGVAVVVVLAGVRFAAYRASGGSRRTLVLAPLGLTGGLWLGQYVGLFSGAPEVAPGELVVLAVLVAVLTALVWWVAHCADLVGQLASSRWRALAWVAVSLTVISFCAKGLSWLNLPGINGPTLITTLDQLSVGAQRLVASGRWTVFDDALNIVVGSPVLQLFMTAPLVTIPLVLAWAIPLVLNGSRTALRPAIVAGALGAVVWLVIELVLRVAGGTVAEAQRMADGFRWVLILWETGAIVLVQFVIVLVLAARRSGAATAFFAAAITGLSSALLLWAARSAEACFPALAAYGGKCPQWVDPSVPSAILGLVVVLSTVVLPIAFVVGRFVLARNEVSRVVAGPRARLALFVVAGIAIALLAVHRPTAGPGPIEKVTAAERTPPLAESPRALATWVKGGGAKHVLELARQSDAYTNSLRDRDVNAYINACSGLVTASAEARKFPEPPGGTSSRLWATMLDEYLAAGTICREVMAGTGAVPGRLELSRSRLHNATSLMNVFTEPFAGG